MKTLFNASAHQQDQVQWYENSKDSVLFVNGGEPASPVISTDQPLVHQCLSSWKGILEQMDEARFNGSVVEGLLLDGYLPYCCYVAQQAWSFRLNVYAPVMKQGADKETPAGIRLVRPIRFVSRGGERGIPHPSSQKFVVIFSQMISGEGREAIADLSKGGDVVDWVRLLPPPRVGGNSEWRKVEEEALAAVKRAQKEGANILSWNVPVEMGLQAWARAKENGVPFYYVQTEPQPDPSAPLAVGIKRMPV